MQVSSDIGRKTVFWYRMYCLLMSLINLLSVIGCVVLVWLSVYEPQMVDEGEHLFAGLFGIVISFVMLLMFALGVILPAKPYHWAYGIALIAIGLSSCLFWPIAIPLIVFWIKTETQQYFGRT